VLIKFEALARARGRLRDDIAPLGVRLADASTDDKTAG